MKSRLVTPTLNSHVLWTAALALATNAICFASSANAQSCRALWIERNSYYKDAGYCFKTAPAIRYFGNAGCIYDNEAGVPLPRGVRARIADIKRVERALGCND
jgi:hypothetical protein